MKVTINAIPLYIYTIIGKACSRESCSEIVIVTSKVGAGLPGRTLMYGLALQQ